jgi:hypothetical protein
VTLSLCPELRQRSSFWKIDAGIYLPAYLAEMARNRLDRLRSA